MLLAYDVGPSAVLKPFVLGAAEFSPVTDPAVVRAAPERAVLAALAHAGSPIGLAVAQATLTGLAGLDPEHAGAYFQLIHDALGPAARAALEQWIMDQQHQGAPLPEFLRQFEARGEARGRNEGLAPLLHLFERKLARSLTDAERTLLATRLTTLGANRIGDVVLDLDGAQLAAWMGDAGAR